MTTLIKHNTSTTLLIFCWLFMLMGLSLPAQALTNKDIQHKILSVKPKQCVALNQGNLCYVDIEITWQLKEAGHYCIYSTQQDLPLQCWENQRSGVYNAEVVAKENVTFSLKVKESGDFIDSSILEIAWVYKKNSRSHSKWRMF